MPAASGSGQDDTSAFRCQKPARGVLWRFPDGTYAPVRCGASNRCPYCAWLVSVENCLVVAEDAKRDQPTVGITLTTPRASFPIEEFRAATKTLFRRVRRHGHDLQYLGLMEWTTGRGGHGRLPHMHALVKGLDPDEAESLKPVIRETWKRATGGAWVVECRPLRTPGGAIAYMVGHHHKREQAPPAGMRGVKRMRPSKGYFSEHPIAKLRAMAKQTMREGTADKRALAKLVAVDPPAEIRDQVLEALWWEEHDRPTPELVRLAKRDNVVVNAHTGEVIEEEPGAS